MQQAIYEPPLRNTSQHQALNNYISDFRTFLSTCVILRLEYFTANVRFSPHSSPLLGSSSTTHTHHPLMINTRLNTSDQYSSEQPCAVYLAPTQAASTPPKPNARAYQTYSQGLYLAPEIAKHHSHHNIMQVASTAALQVNARVASHDPGGGDRRDGEL